MFRIRRWRENHPYAQAVAMLAGGTAAAQILAVAATPFLARLYSVADFGYFQVYASTLMFMATVAALRYEFALLIAEEGDSSANTYAMALAAAAAVAAASAVLILLLYQIPASRDLMSHVGMWPRVFPIALLAAGVMQVQTNWALRRKTFAPVATSKVGQVGTQLAVQIGAGAAGVGAPGLIAGDILGRAVASAGLTWANLRSSAQQIRQATVGGMWRAARRYREFPLVSSGSGLLNVAGVTLPPLLIGYLYGPVVLGLFALVDRLLGGPTMLLGQAISQVYLAEGGRLAAESPQALRALYVRTLRGLLQVAIVPAIIVGIFAPFLFSLVLGPQWREAGVFAQLLLPRHLIAFAVWPLSTTLVLVERQRLQLMWDAARLVATVGAIGFSYWFGASPRICMGTFGIAMFMGYAAHVWICLGILTRIAVKKETLEASVAAAI